VRSEPTVAIVGAGMSGLCMAIKLQQAGVAFTIFEKADEVGGTWRENRYPGLSCDVPSRYYAYTFALSTEWSSWQSPGPEIWDYFKRIADDHGLRDRIRFGAEVDRATWHDGRWRIRTTSGDEHDADVLVTACGVLHHPRLPDIPGLETFEGPAFHSARWDHGARLEHRRVGVVGTGSTGVQIVSEIASEVAHLSHFQRTPQWILPVPNRRYSPLTRRLYRKHPRLAAVAHRYYRAMFEEIFGHGPTRPGWQRSLVDAASRAHLRLAVRDPDLRRALTPDYEPMCKRLVMSTRFYKAVQRPNVDVVTADIERVEPTGVRTADGRLHELDVLVLATGFDAHAYLRPIELEGPGGNKLSEAWSDGPRAYRTIALPGFPNFFMLMGPHSPIGNQSLITVAETQADYVVRFLGLLREQRITAAAPRRDVTERFNDEMRAALPQTVWATGCRSWYLGPDGRPELWPWSPKRHREMLERPELADYEAA
jgi:cation diffusion facilitator CzcD-associated flavoprotein CzcO